MAAAHSVHVHTYTLTCINKLKLFDYYIKRYYFCAYFIITLVPQSQQIYNVFLSLVIT